MAEEKAGRPNDETDNFLAIREALEQVLKDGLTNSLKTISQEHHEIHEGEHFFLMDYSDLNLNENTEYIIETPAGETRAHFVFIVDGVDKIKVDMFRNPTSVVGGTEKVAVNNLIGGVDSIITVLKDPTSIGGDGTSILTQKVGANKQGGNVSRSKEIILEAGEKYLIRITSLANSNTQNFTAEWYEHAPVTKQTYNEND